VTGDSNCHDIKDFSHNNKNQIVTCNNQLAVQQTQQQQHVGYSTVSSGSDLNSKMKNI